MPQYRTFDPCTTKVRVWSVLLIVSRIWFQWGSDSTKAALCHLSLFRNNIYGKNLKVLTTSGLVVLLHDWLPTISGFSVTSILVTYKGKFHSNQWLFKPFALFWIRLASLVLDHRSESGIWDSTQTPPCPMVDDRLLVCEKSVLRWTEPCRKTRWGGGGTKKKTKKQVVMSKSLHRSWNKRNEPNRGYDENKT